MQSGMSVRVRSWWFAGVAGAVGVALGGACVLPAGAEIPQYDLFFNAFYTQTGPSAPASPPALAAALRLVNNDPDAIGDASVTTPDLQVLPLAQFTETEWLYYSPVFASEAAMFAAFPVGTYVYGVLGGTLGPQTGDLVLTAPPLWTPVVPVFTGGTTAALEGMNPSEDLTIEFNGWTPVSGANESLTFVSFIDAGTNEFVLDGSFAPETTSAVIPAGSLAPETAYFAVLYYSSRARTVDAGLGGADALVGYDRVTGFLFVTGSAVTWCVADYNRDGFQNLDDLGDYITDYYLEVPIPGGFQPDAPTYPDRFLGLGEPCPGGPTAPPPYPPEAYRVAGYRVGYSPDGSNSCPLDPTAVFPNLDNLSDFITAYYGIVCP
jgi:hypothetical protein